MLSPLFSLDTCVSYPLETQPQLHNILRTLMPWPEVSDIVSKGNPLTVYRVGGIRVAAIPPAQAWGSISWENLQVHFWKLPDSSKATFPTFCFCGHSLYEYLSGGHWSGSGVHLINTERASHLKMSNLVCPTKSLLCVNTFQVMGIMASVVFVVSVSSVGSEKCFFFPVGSVAVVVLQDLQSQWLMLAVWFLEALWALQALLILWVLWELWALWALQTTWFLWL